MQFDTSLNVFTGCNGAGKTSLLEALHVLARARSFRTSDNRLLIRQGADVAEVAGKIQGPAGCHLAVRLGSGKMEIRVGERERLQAAELVSALPLQSIDADVGALVRGPPEDRRRLLDWGVFHVKHDYLARWRRFRQALLQRNVLLRSDARDGMLRTWELELATTAAEVDASRQGYLRELARSFERLGGALLEREVGLRYFRGWPEGRDLVDVLAQNRESDRTAGYTRAGPHRADLVFEIPDAQRPRWSASRGQQKLLGSALVLAQCDFASRHLERPISLLVDEPAAELDRPHTARFVRTILGLEAQVFLATLTTDGLPLPSHSAMFHVEHGSPKALL